MSAEDDFDISAKLGVEPPCYVRQVKSVSCCGDKEKESSERRATLIVENVLSEDGGILSVFYAGTTRELIRAALALNHARGGGDKFFDFALIALLPAELEGIKKEQTPDRFVCYWAQHNHLNLTLIPSDQHRVADLVAKRKGAPSSFSRKKMKRAGDLMREAGCRSVDLDSANCVCEQE